MKESKQLDLVQSGLVRLAHERYNAAMRHAQIAAAADVDQAMLPLRVALGLPPNQPLSLDELPEGVYMATWEVPDAAPAPKADGPKLVKGKKR